MKSNLIGFVQGRLTKSPNNSLQYFPKKWDEEFKNANKLRVNFIELFSERKFNSKNPIWSKNGVESYKKNLKKNSLKPYAFTDNYIISNNLKLTKTKKYLNRLIKQINSLNIKFLILPMYGKSILTDKNYVSFIKSLKILTKNKKVKFLIESNISISTFKKIEKEVNNRNLFFLYDVGNRALLGNDPEIDILQLGKKRLKHVHIKDKNTKGMNVKLGTGIAKFKKVFKALNKINYRGAFAFETTRQNNPIQTMRYNIKFLKNGLNV